ncbi:MAG: metallophosphoesterase [Clostridia bacterium]|nr:metallophosphoesterase [Clostridia bacterium]
MKIGLFSDPHYCDKDMVSGGRYHALSYGKIKEAMDSFKKEGVGLVICLGDLVDDCGNEQENIRSIKKITELIDSYGIKFYSLMGNHDYQNFTREEFNRYTNGAYPPFSLELDDAILVFLDCNYEDTGKIYEVGKVDWTNTFLPNDQLLSLEKVLSKDSEKNIIIFSHQIIEEGLDNNHTVRNAKDIRALISSCGRVTEVIQGHYHPGHDEIINNVRYHTLPAMCEGKENRFECFEIVK